MATLNGWAGKILTVDLTTRRIEVEPLDEGWALKYIGGGGFGARLLYDEVGPEVEPLSPDNIIVIGQGPLSGTLAPASGRYELVAKSPVTGIFGRSNSGGNFGPELKYAGYDLIVIRGKSETPVYLWIEDDQVELRDATHLWGRTTWEARRLVCDEHKARVTDRRYLGNIATLLIGPAGENLCMASCVIAGLSRAAAKTGMGAVWGSKNLKGVAVRGSKGINVARPAELLQLCKNLWLRFKDDPLYETHSKYGPLSWVGGICSRSPVGKALTGGERAESIEETALEPFFERNLACFACPLHCSHFFNVSEGKYKGTKGEGPEATLQLFALGWKAFSPEFLLRYYNLCSQLGINVDAPAAAISWAMNLWEAGIITKEDTDGLEVTRGNEDVILELLRKVAYKEGFGELLDGYPVGAVQRLGRGSDKYASHTKGLPTYNFTSGIGNSLEYTLALNVSTRGFDVGPAPYMYRTDYRTEWGITRELLTNLGQARYGDPKIFIEPWVASSKKAQVVCDLENMGAIADMTGICTFATQIALCLSGMSMQDFAELLTTATGRDFHTEDLTQAAERKVLLERAYNAREGIRRTDDYPFFLRWQLDHGTPHPLFDYEGLPVKLDDYDKVLDEYYRLLGCNIDTGIPTATALECLGLKDVADDLQIRKISLV